MASSGGFKPSHLPPITETGIQGFLKWLQRENPTAYQHIAPSLPAMDPRMFSDYNQSMAQIVRGRAGAASLLKRGGIMGGLGQAEYGSAVPEFSTQIQVLAPSDLAPVNVSTDESTLNYSIPTNVDTTDAANQGSGTSTASTDWISSAIHGITSLWLTKAQLQTSNAITNLQLQRAQAGYAPLNIGLGANGIPVFGSSALGGGSTLLLLGGGLLVLFMLMRGGRKAA
jgi:hypothetical protein